MKKIITVLLLLSLSTMAKEAFDRTQFFGEPVKNAKGELEYVEENKSQTHSKENYVFVKVTGINTKADDQKARVRIAVWDSKDNFADEKKKPYRACSHWAREAVNKEMKFKIGVEPGKSYSFFAHLDEMNRGKVHKIFMIPTEPYMFTSAKTQGKGTGIKREGLSVPKFESTLVKYTGPGQVIELNF